MKPHPSAASCSKGIYCSVSASQAREMHLSSVYEEREPFHFFYKIFKSQVLEWFDYLLQQRGLIIIEDRSIAGEWTSANDLLVLWNSRATVMAEQAFPLYLVWGFHFIAKTISGAEGVTSLSPACNYLVKITAQKFEFN